MMTNQQLQDKIKSHNGFLNQENALLAVVKLHEPIEAWSEICGVCHDSITGKMHQYPCLTIQVIERELDELH